MIDGTKKPGNITLTALASLNISDQFFHRVSPVRLLCSVDTGCRVTCLSAWHPGLRWAGLFEHQLKPHLWWDISHWYNHCTFCAVDDPICFNFWLWKSLSSVHLYLEMHLHQLSSSGTKERRSGSAKMGRRVRWRKLNWPKKRKLLQLPPKLSRLKRRSRKSPRKRNPKRRKRRKLLWRVELRYRQLLIEHLLYETLVAVIICSWRIKFLKPFCLFWPTSLALDLDDLNESAFSRHDSVEGWLQLLAILIAQQL